MPFSLRALWTTSRPGLRKVATGGPRFRPIVEGFEDRVVPAAPVDLGAALAAPVASPASLLPIDINSVTFDPVTGVINAAGTIGSQAFTATGLLTLTPQTSSDGVVTPILHLELNAIHLDLLGLKVDTSDICLDITAESGSGNLLGNLLTGIANLLNGPNPPAVGGILGGLNATQLTTLTDGLTGVLNGVFDQLGSRSAVAGTTTNILHLELGPVNLDLLGLGVSLDDCDGGPVTVDISAESGPGRLLGNLLSGLAGALDGNNLGAVDRFLDRIADRIDKLVNR